MVGRVYIWWRFQSANRKNHVWWNINKNGKKAACMKQCKWQGLKSENGKKNIWWNINKNGKKAACKRIRVNGRKSVYMVEILE